ncbi:MAG: cation:dicarboxylase symporter family transporter, partial [Gemmatimonadaceae bacterium]|nr:cation:dicarboxylase symporter family transporter [Gemmatimonadaceae bacterium]
MSHASSPPSAGVPGQRGVGWRRPRPGDTVAPDAPPSRLPLPVSRPSVKRLWQNLTFRVLSAVALGVLVGILWPEFGKALKPLGDTFVNLVRMVIAPIIFLTIVAGIATIGDLKHVGRVGGKAFLYFEVVTTFALGIGLIVVNVTKPGAGLDASAMAKGDISRYTAAGEQMKFVDFLVHIVPSSVVDAFAKGEILQVVFFAVLFGVALTMSGEIGRNITDGCERLAQVFFKIVGIIMHVAPLGAFGAMAFTVGSFGLKTLLPLGRLMLDVYLTMFLFVFVVLNIICRIYGFSLWEFIKYIREEILLVLGTSSSEAALPRMLEKLER